MPTIESQIRTINRQLEEYRKRLGTESEEYEELTTRLQYLLGDVSYNKKGNLFYSRAKSYDIDDLETAYGLVTGNNTAAQIEQQYIRELVDQYGVEYLTPKNVKRYVKIKNKLNRYYGELYNYLKNAYEEENGSGSWDNSDLRNEYGKRGASNGIEEDSALWISDEIVNLKGGDPLTAIERALADAEKRATQTKKRASEKANGTRSERKKPKEFGSGLF